MTNSTWLCVCLLLIICFAVPAPAAQSNAPARGASATSPLRPQTAAPRPRRRRSGSASRRGAAGPTLPKVRVVREPASFAALREGLKAQQEEAGREELWNYHGAYLYWLQQRAYPKGDVDWNAYARAFIRRSRTSSVRFFNPKFLGAPSPRWQFLGPKNLPVPYQQYYGQGTVSGRVNGVAFDPNNPKVIYLASAGGGFWKSTDDGMSWACLSDKWENVKFTSVAVHPTNSNIIVVGTGDYTGALGYGYGLMMTTDGGATWKNLLKDELRWYSVSQILFDPDDSRVIIATAGRHPQNKGKIMRSADGGQTWSPVNTQAGAEIDWGGIQVSAKEADGTRNYYAVGVLSGNRMLPPGTRQNLLRCAPGHLWRSRDRGQTWQRLAEPPAGGCMEIMDVATSPTSPRTVYLATHAYSSGNVPGQVWMNPDAGDGNWSDITNNFPHHYNPAKQDAYNWSQAAYDFYIRCTRHPLTGKDVLYIGLIDIAASTDGGQTWHSVGQTYTPNARTHNDQHAIAFNPRDPNDLIVGNDGGVYRLTFKPARNPARDAWEFKSHLNAGLGMTMFYRIAIDPANPDWVIGGAQDNATPVSLGDLNRWVNKGGGDGGFCAINPLNNKVQYATTQNLSIVMTDDGWQTDRQIAPTERVVINGQPEDVEWGFDNRGFIAPIALSPSDPKKLYAGTNYLYRWDEDRRDWTGRRLGNQELASGGGYVNFIAVSPTDGKRIYTGSNVGDLWMTTNGGDSWQRIDNLGLPGATPALPVTSIAVHPTNPDSILVGYGSTEGFPHLWRCDNTQAGELRWTPLGGAGSTALPFIPLNAIAIDPRKPDSTYYVGTDVGVFLSNDSGASWGNFGMPLGLPNVQVTDLHLVTQSGNRRLVAATFGRGVWRIELSEETEPLYFKPAVRGVRRRRRIG